MLPQELRSHNDAQDLLLLQDYWGGPFLRVCFFLRCEDQKKAPSLSYLYVFVTRKAPCYVAVTWERRRTKILKGLCGVIGWFQVAADIELPLK